MCISQLSRLKNYIILILFIVFCNLLIAQNNSEIFLTDAALKTPQNFKDVYDRAFGYNEIPVFIKSKSEKTVVLENGYADYRIKNPADWTLIENAVPYQVDVVFTKYPWNKSDWLTNYYDLLSKRLDELFSIDPKLNNPAIKWNLVLQTNCKSEDETRTYFHGIIIKYYIEGEKKPEVTESEKIQPELTFTEAEKYAFKVSAFMDYLGGVTDPGVYNVLSRISGKDNSIVVMDWTASMYTYSAQAIMWHLKNLQRSGIKDFAFFNDGDRKQDLNKIPGETGGIYHVSASQMDSVLILMDKVMQMGSGGDWPENDVEAILSAISMHPEAKQVFLIADNNSAMRDYELISKINKPVHVILCGVDQLINVEYINLAYKTGGSLHTEDEDFYNIGESPDQDNCFLFGQHKYRINENGEITMEMSYDRFWYEEQIKYLQKPEDKKKRVKMPDCPQF
ncbi:MAG: hypothetical protein A2W91_04725 [Bacteroidetes bacterium GWF2_38_335]|nr:MAG: hypothetical protein A2W91_04725 [Bacteroidetes bacterium GWF2_38_335]OFY80028.1 MAG: hypothetical protein A2281_12130 [Bacteroidetes bacterium RIFOXYA12_FULL_38_20]HBS85236.1 hypothetical protein [Bacteroidales bacterium]